MKKVLTIVGAIVLGFVVLGVGIFLFVSMTSKKFVCTSPEGSITLMYNDKTITGYTANGITYDKDGQAAYAESVGVQTYLDEFNDWFMGATSGSCVRK